MRRILLLFPSVFHTGPDGTPLVKTYLLGLASSLSELAQTQVIDLDREFGRPDTPEEIELFRSSVRQRLSGLDFDLLGISCWSSRNYLAAVAVAEIARSVRPSALIIVGGYHATAVPEDFGDKELFDVVVRGEGEWALERIVRGEILPEPGRVVHVTSPLGHEPALAAIDWEGCGFFDERQDGQYPRMVPIALSRGCPFGCTFCMEPVMGRRWRPLPVDEAIARVDRLIGAIHPVSVGFADACLGVDRRWRRAFLRRLIDLDAGVMYMLQCRTDLLDREDIDLLAELPVVVELGVETFSPAMVSLMKKSPYPARYIDHVRELSRYANQHGVVHRFNLLFNHPGETLATVDQTIERLVEVLGEKTGSVTFWAADSYAYYPGSHVYHARESYESRYGARIHHPEWWKMDGDPEVLSRIITPSSELGLEESAHWSAALAQVKADHRKRLHPDLREVIPSW